MTDAGSAPRIYVDTTIFLDAFEGQTAQAERVKAIFTSMASKPGLAVTSEFTLAEVLGKEAVQGWAWQRRFYLDLIDSGGLFDVRPVTRALLVATGAFRKAARDEGRSARLGDAIHAVTAVDACCRHLFTSDRRFPVPPGLSRLALDEASLAAVERIARA